MVVTFVFIHRVVFGRLPLSLLRTVCYKVNKAQNWRSCTICLWSGLTPISTRLTGLTNSSPTHSVPTLIRLPSRLTPFFFWFNLGILVIRSESVRGVDFKGLPALSEFKTEFQS